MAGSRKHSFAKRQHLASKTWFASSASSPGASLHLTVCELVLGVVAWLDSVLGVPTGDGKEDALFRLTGLRREHRVRQGLVLE